MYWAKAIAQLCFILVVSLYWHMQGSTYLFLHKESPVSQASNHTICFNNLYPTDHETNHLVEKIKWMMMYLYLTFILSIVQVDLFLIFFVLILFYCYIPFKNFSLIWDEPITRRPKRENPKKNHVAHRQAELGLSHIWPRGLGGSNSQQWDGKKLSAPKASSLKHRDWTNRFLRFL